MRLRALRLHGFKSFADSVEIEFHSGITAVVGPNGCGKSNISDAIRWVLGEQRPSVIRGARMEEAIFQGSVHRRPVNRGSVSMRVSNEDGTLPVPFEEVEIGRVVYRDGGSEYRLNRSVCRLKDVVDLCRDTGLGSDAYAVIEHRMIDAILSDRAEERRSLFEEASGVGKYKDRRRTAVRRLERAELDLERLEDVIAEVESKVRSLARQKGKAERYHELRSRHLDVEIAVVRHDLRTTGERLAEVDRELERDRAEGEGKVAHLRSAETEYETLRLREAEVERERTDAARALDEMRQEIVRWERDLAVAEEQRRGASARLERIVSEREEIRVEAARTDAASRELSSKLDELAADVRIARTRFEEADARASEARDALTAHRVRLEESERRERDLARKGVLLTADADSARAQAAELERRVSQLATELDRAADALSDFDAQGDLFSDRLDGLRQAADEARKRAASAQAALAAARARLHETVQEDVAAVERAAGARARLEALERMEAEGEGVEPALRALLEAGVEGVVGALRDFIRPGSAAKEVERFLGGMADAVVVADASAARAVIRWFETAWGKGGGLVVLPLDAAPKLSGGGSLLQAAGAHGRGAPWVEALLAGVELVAEGATLEGTGPRVGRDGVLIEATGVIRVGDSSGTTRVLERRDRIDTLKSERAQVEDAAATARAARNTAEQALFAAEEALGSAREQLHTAEEDFRRAKAEADDHSDARARTDRHRDEIARQLEGTRSTRERLLRRAEEADADRTELTEVVAAAHEEAEVARRAMEGVSVAWEEAQREASARGADLQIREREETGLRERSAEMAERAGSLRTRLDALDREEAERTAELEAARKLNAEGADVLERLFLDRGAAEEELSARTAAHRSIREELEGLEAGLRRARAEERSAAERRHALELERQELAGRLERIRDRLEAEWGRSMERLLDEANEVEGEPDELRRELGEIVGQLERLGPVNMLAVEEHSEESQRLDFLRAQHADLTEARDDLRSAIREINRTATRLFTETFDLIRDRFRDTYQRLFEGGEADLWLADPDDPLESQIEIHASPRGKKTQRIDLLSGGERALTALSLLFGIYLVKPSPFCVLDEVDAPLDEANIGRFVRLLQEFKDQTQFVVITHNPRTIEAADWIYGVTMEEPGVSTIVGVRLEEALQTSSSAA